MARILADNERLIQRATLGLRTPGGTIENVALYEIITVDKLDRRTGLTADEIASCADFARDIAPKFKQYADGMRATKRGTTGTV